MTSSGQQLTLLWDLWPLLQRVGHLSEAQARLFLVLMVRMKNVF